MDCRVYIYMCSTSSQSIFRSEFMNWMNYYGSQFDSMIYSRRQRCFYSVLAYIIVLYNKGTPKTIHTTQQDLNKVDYTLASIYSIKCFQFQLSLILKKIIIAMDVLNVKNQISCQIFRHQASVILRQDYNHPAIQSQTIVKPIYLILKLQLREYSLTFEITILFNSKDQLDSEKCKVSYQAGIEGLQIYQTSMNSLSVALKRKSVDKVQPTLPKAKKQREPSREGRTIYYQLQSPSQELKQFRKKQLYTVGHLSTEKSDTNNNSDELPMKQSRFDDDHHNTQSIAQLLNSKMGSNLPTVRTKLSKESIDKTDEKIQSYKDSLQSDSLPVKDSIGSKQKDESYEGLGDSREGQNYDDYVLGEKVDEEQESSNGRGLKAKKYANDYNSKPLSRYVPKTASQLRAQQIHINNERKRLLQLHEDQQIISIMQQYKNNRKNLMNQSKRKHQTARMLASLPKPQAKIEKSTSLPALKPKQEVILPELYEGPQTKQNLIAKDFQQRKENKYIQRRVKQSLSFGKLGFGRKRVRTICEEDLYEEQMNTVEQIRNKLKAKGICLDANKLAKGIVNQKNIANYEGIMGYPQARLPSNPIYKKFPL